MISQKDRLQGVLLGTENGLGKLLAFWRCDHRLTRGELAARMGCTEEKISRIESAKDDECSIKDFLDYGMVLGLKSASGLV